MSTVAYNPLANLTTEFKTAHTLMLNPKTDIFTLMTAVGMNTQKVADVAARGIVSDMHKQNGRAELANQAKALEEKIKAAAKNASAADKDKLSGKGWDTAKADAAKLKEVYKQLGVNGEYQSKLDSGDFTLLDLEAMQTATKGVSDSTTSANQMLNLDLSRVNNFLNMALNFLTKVIETIKTNLGMILQGMGR
jgi:hypothetical protein